MRFAILERMARPVCKGFVKLVCSVCVNVSGLGIMSRPRWRSAQSGPHNQTGLDRSFNGPGFQAAVRLSGHLPFTTRRLAATISPAADDLLFLCRGDRRIEAALLAQHRPDDAREFGGQRNHHDILVCPFRQATHPPAQRRILTLERIAQGWSINQIDDLMPWNFKA